MTSDPGSPLRLPFYDVTNSESQRFARELLALVPEMDAVAIIPSWKIQHDRLAIGVVAGSTGPLSNPLSLMLMIEQLLAAARIQTRSLEELLQIYDREAKRLADVIHTTELAVIARHDEISQLDTKIEERRRALESAG